MNIIKSIIISLMLIIMTGCSQHEILITAHRGASGVAPENTMSAYLLAMEMNAEYAELDVQETADDVLVLFHDKNYIRTAGDSSNVWDMPYDSIVGFDVGSWKREAYAGEPIPLFADIIDSVNGRMKLNVEIKMNGHQDGLTEHVLEVLQEKNFADQCIITSFNLDAVDKIRALDPSFTVGYIFSKMPKDRDVFVADVDLLSVKNKLVTKEFVEKAHAAGKKVHVWGKVDEPEEMERLYKLKIDSPITNHPDRWRTFLSEKK